MKKRINVRAVIAASVITALAIAVWSYARQHTNEANLRKQLQSQSENLEIQIKALKQSKQDTKQLQQQKEDLQKQLQAKRDEQAKIAAADARNTAIAEAAALEQAAVAAAPAPAPVPVTPAPQPVTSCGSDPYMAYIYKVESGCRTNAYNPIGCRGLGQSCPGSKLPCSDADWACQDAWFRNYAVQRYGSIYNAYVFRSQNNWW